MLCEVRENTLEINGKIVLSKEIKTISKNWKFRTEKRNNWNVKLTLEH